MECKKENHDSFHIRKRGWKKIQQRVNLISNVISFLSYCVMQSEEKYVNVKIWNDKLTTGHIMWFPWEFTNTHVYSLLERNCERMFLAGYRKKIKLFRILGAYLESHVCLAWHLIDFETTACWKCGISLLMFEIRILWFSEEFFRLLHINCIIQGLY